MKDANLSLCITPWNIIIIIIIIINIYLLQLCFHPVAVVLTLVHTIQMDI
jgi:hypothetical protein